ncbi:DNA-directed RNA polymerase III subunit RPC5-like isoform X2 [Asparagus officinalis]|uniref:DNA-directed RNA polymerase III subunit RPC5-like isoform X2 n=1 Tax=Asparagus officinalis TaxID=4686 RepID=UPI00098E009D|nr:DNA-directed RNA polymerase III subunit RPC5-like isoform X2 [Asparagus officinalis]
METADLFGDKSIMDLDSDPTPSRPIPPRFKPKLKGKTKAEPSADPELDQSKTAALSIPTPMEVDDDDGDEEDKVVCEIDVYCNRLDEDSQLYIMQYPLRPYWRPYELDERCEMVKVKPKHSEVELVMSVDVESENYDASKPGTPRLQKQILSSSSASSTVQYAAGILIKNQLHLSPIHEVLQFRPSMKHIDECEAQQVMHKTEEVANKANKGKLVLGDSADHLDNAEPWVSLEYHPIGSELSCKYQQKLMTQKDYNVNFTMSPFCPSLPLEERLKEWLCKGCQVNRFAALTYLDSTIPKEDFLKVLEKFAFLVQGLWVSKSSLICEGYEAQLRDYILFLFSQNHVIKQSKLKELKISDEDLRQFLRPLAYERLSLGDWKLREERDSSFIKEHLEIVKEQEIAWLNRGKHIKEILSKPGRFLHVKAKNSPISNVGQKKASAHVDTGSNRTTDVPGRKLAASMSSENRKSLRNALFHIFRDRTALR